MNPDATVTIPPARGLSGQVLLPGDKSISHRYAMLGALAEGTTRLENYSAGADCQSTLGCLRALGVEWAKPEGAALAIEGKGAKLHPPPSGLDCGNSGSTMRMLSGILAGQDFTSELVGDESLSRRPMARVIEPLSAMGATIRSAPGSRPPLRIRGGRLQALRYRVPVPSAQVKTALLFAGLYAEGETEIEEAIRTRDHGEIALRTFGAELEQRGNAIAMRGRQRLHAVTARVPGDLSSAAFFLCATALFPGAKLTLPNVLLNPTRARLLDVLIALGLRVSVLDLEQTHGELVGSVEAEGMTLGSMTLAGADTSALIDEIPVLAAIAPYTTGGIEIRDAGELRVKESDRIAAVAANLRAMGATLEERADGLRIPGGQQLHGAVLDSFGDHRIAMAFAVAALRADGETQIKGADAAVISYPAFYSTLETLVER